MKNIILILFCLFSVASFAQQKGIVTNIEKEPLVSAEVYLHPLGILTNTDINGEFNFNIDLPPKSVLVFSKEGYQTFSYQTDNTESKISITLQKLHVLHPKTTDEQRNSRSCAGRACRAHACPTDKSTPK